jgi:hypothetical protein
VKQAFHVKKYEYYLQNFDKNKKNYLFLINNTVAIMIGMKKGRVTVKDRMIYEMSFWA